MARQPADGMDAVVVLLERRLARHWGGSVAVANVRRLTGGANRQTLAFEATRAGGAPEALILRRDQAAAAPPEGGPGAYGPGWAGEYALLEAAARAGVPVPPVVTQLTPDDGLGEGFVMRFVAGETVARRILREPVFAPARAAMAGQLGRILGRIHAIPLGSVPPLTHVSTRRHIELYRQRLALWPEPMPVLEFGLRWIAERCPSEAGEVVRLVHGDFRHGNLIVGPEGVRAVLDWEIAHAGDPYEDLGWLCTRAWRFGGPEPVGGFGRREDLFAAYEAETGMAVDRARARFWEVFGSLRWGIMCLGLADRHLSGRVRSLELAAIGRRVSENEHDLLQLIAEEGTRAGLA